MAARGQSAGRELRELAILHSIQPAYRDASGRRKEASPEGLLATLRALGAPVQSPRDVADALCARREEICRRAIEPVTVWWSGEPLALRVMVEDRHRDAGFRFRIDREDGTTGEIEPLWAHDRPGPELGSRRFVQRWFHFAATRLEPGYHRLHVAWPGSEHATLVLAAPQRAWSTPNRRRMWGLFAPVYALRSTRDWGVGDLTDFSNFIREIVDFGGSGVATLPLLSTFLSEPFEPSPYAPVSRLFWNELFLDPTRTAEFRTSEAARAMVESAAFREAIDRSRGADFVDYRETMALKRRVLEILTGEFFERAPAARRDELARYQAARPRAEAYARFRAAVEKGRWPGPAPADGLIELEPGEEAGRRYHLYAQWQCERQLESVAGLARSSGFGLYLDFPLGVHGGGFDAWLEHDDFAHEASTGAPPDLLFSGGQDWGAPPLHPECLRQNGYRYLIDSLRAVMRYAGVLRFDHVMALHRLYWIPRGVTAHDGVYVRYAKDEHFAILAIESHRHRTTIVGEDLGTVPAVVRRRMNRHGIRRMYVLQYEIGPGGHVADPTPDAVASLNTHDMPPFAGFLHGTDIGERAAHGQADDEERQRRERAATVEDLARFLESKGYLGPGRRDAAELFRGATEFLARSDAELLLVNVEDLWQATASQNLPGTHLEHPNWRRKLDRRIEDIVDDPELVGRLQRIDEWRRQGRRG
ncbi:MAG: 4-alpha-glucanotransferase [Thermoanaerobaculia bacterium]